MSKLVKTGMLSLGLALVAVGPAAAQQPAMDDCTKMVAAIRAEAGRRFDAASYTAKMKADEATKLCKEGKKADAEKVTKETAASLGLKM
jgi:predicted lipoprotein